jgi:hypothetical protein
LGLVWFNWEIGHQLPGIPIKGWFLCFWKNGAASNFRVGIELPKIEVRFEHLDICAEVYVGSRALPTLPNFLLTLAEVCLAWQSMMDIIVPSIKFSQWTSFVGFVWDLSTGQILKLRLWLLVTFKVYL